MNEPVQSSTRVEKQRRPAETNMNLTKKQARVAGLLYLLIGITVPIGLVYIPGKLIVAGDAAATANGSSKENMN
jgi:hypothetical protein